MLHGVKMGHFIGEMGRKWGETQMADSVVGSHVASPVG